MPARYEVSTTWASTFCPYDVRNLSDPSILISSGCRPPTPVSSTADFARFNNAFVNFFFGAFDYLFDAPGMNASIADQFL